MMIHKKRDKTKRYLNLDSFAERDAFFAVRLPKRKTQNGAAHYRGKFHIRYAARAHR